MFPQHFSFSQTSISVSITRKKHGKCFLFLKYCCSCLRPGYHNPHRPCPHPYHNRVCNNGDDDNDNSYDDNNVNDNDDQDNEDNDDDINDDEDNDNKSNDRNDDDDNEYNSNYINVDDDNDKNVKSDGDSS